ncbi:MAG: hypothetical protein LC790_08275, partial [Actinobacteria bacterium]|nr:hypothetical protein [Actinomycetota bacterium]
PQAINIRRRDQLTQVLSPIREQTDIDLPTAEINPACNIEDGPPLSSLLGDSRSVSPEEALLHGSPEQARGGRGLGARIRAFTRLSGLLAWCVSGSFRPG